MIVNGYIDRKGVLTDKYYDEKANVTIKVAEEAADCAPSVIAIIDTVYDEKIKPAQALGWPRAGYKQSKAG